MSKSNQSSIDQNPNSDEQVKKPNKPWYTYLLRCADNSLYAGVTTDLKRRVKEHNGKSKAAAKYTRVRQPVELVYFEQVANRVVATKREYQIKQLTKQQKETMVARFTQP